MTHAPMIKCIHNQSRQYLVKAYDSTLIGSISSPDASNICIL